jgi:hypothetical protein
LLAEKEAHSVIVRQEMERKNHERVSSILGVAQRKEESMARTANEREWQNMIKKEQEVNIQSKLMIQVKFLKKER